MRTSAAPAVHTALTRWCAFRWESAALQIHRFREHGLAVWGCKGLGAWAGQGRASVRTAVGGSDPLHRQVEEPLEAILLRSARHALQPNRP
jgi:hypothetical protein